MSPTRYGRPYWIDAMPAGRVPTYPRQRGSLDVQVAIVGGGLTGCAVAYALATAGVRVAVLEAGRIGQGSTAASLGVLCQEPEATFQDTVERHGLRAARRMFQMWRRAALDAAAGLRRLRIRCDLAAGDGVRLAVADPDARQLRRDFDARRDAGFDVSWLRRDAVRRLTRADAEAGVRAQGDAQLDPYRACLGLARAASARGALIFGGSRVGRVRPGRKAVEIRTDAGEVRAERLVFATHYASDDVRSLARHFVVTERFAVATPPIGARVRAQMAPAALALRDSVNPPHAFRWTPEGRVLFAGADGRPVPERHKEKSLIQRTGQLMYELSLLYPAISGTPAAFGWSGVAAVAADGLPYIGAHRNFPRCLFALGFGRDGASGAWLAARILTREVLGEPEKGDELFGWTR